MKVILCAVNSKYIHSSLSVWYLAGALEKYAPDVDCEIVEATVNEKYEDILERIDEIKADIIGFSTYIWNRDIVLKLAKDIKERQKVKILLGGPEVSYNAEQILKKYLFVDYIISGEGEWPLAQLCKNEELSKINGLNFRQKDNIYLSEPYISNVDPPNPYSAKYFEMLNGRITYIETSRGCPYRCAFCLSGRCGGIRFFDLEKAKENILLLANSGTQTVKFIDRTFNADRKRAIEIFKFIIANYGEKIPRSVRFHFEMDGELIDESTIDVLSCAPSGLMQFEIGIQSFNEKTLESVNRKSNFKKLKNNIVKLLELKNIHIHIDLIAGLPYENLQSFKKSFNEAYELKAHMLQLGFLKLLHGAEMRENKERYKHDFSNTPPYEIKSNEWLSEFELEQLHQFEDVFEKMYNSNRFADTVEYLNGFYESYFDMYMGFSMYMKALNPSNTLDEITRAIYDYFSQNPLIDPRKLRDKLAIDRLATNRMGALPSFLKVKSPNIKKFLNLLEKSEETKRMKAVKRSATVLLSENKLVYVDYDRCDPVTKRYKTKFVDIIE